MFSLARNCVGGLVRCAATKRLLTSSVVNRYVSTTSTRFSQGTNDSLIPIIDMGRIGLDHNPGSSDSDWERVAKELSDAFEQVGFAYLSGHGVSMSKVDRLQEVAKSFFTLPEGEKMKYERDLVNFHGYFGFNAEVFQLPLGRAQEGNNELRESYNFRAGEGFFYPDKTVPDFRPAACDFLDSSMKLVHRLLKVMAVGLGLPTDFFLKNHSAIGHLDGNRSGGRVAYYPPVPETVTPDTVRLGAHSDFITFTLVFQDDVGGLQIRDTKGDWVDATPIAGTAVVNVGDMLQFWTGGKFKATEHRIVIPEIEIRRRQARLSAIYFTAPNDSTLIQPLDGSNAFDPITAGAYIEKKTKEFY